MKNLFMRFPGGKTKAFTMSYDDGVIHDVRLMEIMNRYDLKGTFNLNSGMFRPEEIRTKEDEMLSNRLSQDEVVSLYKNSGHEVAVHGLSHPFFEQLPINRAAYEIIEDRKRLEKLFGYTVRGMAYPYGTYNDEVVRVLQAAGMVYARGVKSTEKFDIPNDWLRLSPTCHHRNPRLTELCDEFVQKQVKETPQLFYLWGHSYEFDENNNWNIIENFAEKISGNEDIWYATNISIFDYITSYRQLRFGIDMKFVENPTAADLCFMWNDNLYAVNAGETISL